MQSFLLLVAVVLGVVNAQNFGEGFNSTSVGGLFKVAPAVVDIDLAAYIGYWYQMYADPLVMSTIEKNSFCDSALYGAPDASGHISVKNTAKINGPTAADGDYVITGDAYCPDSSKPGELMVKFDPDQGAPDFAAPYWVLELGPINDKGMYDYAIVSDNLSQFLFVLARDYTEFNAKYDASVQTSLNNLGFKGYKKPISIHQGADCDYK